jgi:hypothetical protein
LPHTSLVADEDQDCLCPECLPTAIEQLERTRKFAAEANAGAPESCLPSPLVAGEDYYSEGSAIVFTARYHLRRGYCCDNGCRHCPYRPANPPNIDK